MNNFLEALATLTKIANDPHGCREPRLKTTALYAVCFIE